jgi:uncharacterized protein YqhQ
VYGGQAVIEGVMMRGQRACVVAVRDPAGQIVFERFNLGRIYGSRWAKLPFLRGLLVLWDALGLGMRALTYSANVQAEADEEKLEGPALWITIGTSLAVGIGVFFLLPTGVAAALERVFVVGPWWINVLEGLIRLGLLLGYLLGIGQMAEVKRVFSYHGAEHMTINAFEAGAELTPDSVSRYPLEHPRCGTAFLVTVVLLSVLIFSLIGPLGLASRLLSRILLIPMLAAISYEYLRFTARHSSSWWVRPFLAPNLLAQRLTTRRPDHKMIEVAIAAFESMRELEASEAEKAPGQVTLA